MSEFILDNRIEADSHMIISLGLCQLRLMNDSRWPWLLLVPQRGNIKELFELTPLDQTMLTFEAAMATKALKSTTGADKINIGSLGNKVSQFHLHLIAREVGDPAWPGPVWGHGKAVAYDPEAEKQFTAKLLEAL